LFNLTLKKILVIILSFLTFFIASTYLYGFLKLGDDTYIYLQYARNILTRGEIAFNVGEKSYGFTSPLWLGIIIALEFFIKNLQLIPQILSMIFSLLTIFCWYFIIRSIFKKERLITISLLLIVLSLDPNLLKHSYLGMEAPLSLLLSSILVFIIINYTGSRDNIKIALIFGIYLLVRPESILLLMITLFWLTLFRDLDNRSAFRILITVLIIVLPWLIFSQYYFGSMVPNTFNAKGFNYTFGGRFFINFFDSLKIIGGNYLFIFIITVFAFPLLRRTNYFKINRDIILLIFSLIITPILFYSIGLSREFVYARYYSMIFPFISLFLLLLLYEIKLYNSKLNFSIIFSLFYLIIISLIMSPITKDSYLDGENVENKIVKWVEKNTDREDIIVRGRIGKIGFLSGRKILDPMGIINPDLFMYHNENELAAFYEIHKPTYVIGSFDLKLFGKSKNIELVTEFQRNYSGLPRHLIMNKKYGAIIPIYKITWNNN